jgi:hypothetical protein
MGKIWSDAAIRYLEDRRICPRCDAQLDRAWCPECGADYSGPLGGELRNATGRVVKAMRARDRLLERVPTVWPAGSPVAAPVAVADGVSVATAERVPVAVAAADAFAPAGCSAARGSAAGSSAPAGASPSAQLSVQSVLAFAGSALLAVAALVFTFLNPDLTSFAVRTTITGIITVVFLGGAWLFARRGLRFSAESVGALGVVFGALDLWAFVQLTPAGVPGWTFAALGTFVGSAVLFALGARTGVRVWLWAGVLGLALSPGLLGSGGTLWNAVLGSLGVAIVALGLQPLLARLTGWLGSSLAVERDTASTLQVLAVLAALGQSGLLLLGPGPVGLLGHSGVLLVLAVVAALSSHNGLPRAWSFAAGAFAVGAVALLPTAVSFDDSAWYLALLPVAAGVAVVALAALRPSPAANGGSARAGSTTVLLLVTAPALITIAMQLTGAFFAPLIWLDQAAAGGRDFAYVAGAGTPTGYGAGLVAQNLGLAAIVAVAALAATTGAVGLLSRAHPPVPAAGPARLSLPAGRTALWLFVCTLLTVASWAGFSLTGQAAVGLALAAALIVALRAVPALAKAPPAIRHAVGGGAHLLLLLAAITGWMQQSTVVWVGAAAVLGLAALALSVHARWHPLYLGVGYAYALVILATALTLAGVDGIAVLCLTTSVGLLCALAATLTTWLSPRSWYAILGVSAVPFVAGVVAVLLVRSGWTALSTALAFALAFTLMTTRRPGLTTRLRATAAGLLVPSLAVVVVCLGAQLLPTSGSPVVLPVIAAIVAGTFASAALIEAALVRHGLTIVEAAAARRWIELSAAVTGLLAVLLALVRTAAGLPTTILVLLILGTGAAVTAFTTRRHQAWWAAGASWTGALWCVLAGQGIEVLELYVLPPTLVMLTVGVLLLLRGRSGRSLAATGLALAVLPSLLALIINGSGGFGATQSPNVIPWRAVALLAASLVLVAVGYGIRATRHASLGSLLGATAVVATLAAAAGSLQAVRWGLGLDRLTVSPQTGVMVPVLAISAVATLLAIGAASVTRQTVPSEHPRERWRYAAATAILVVGPISAIGPEPFAIGTLVLLMVALLGFLLVVAARARTAAVSLPPVWFLFALAWCTAVAGWSERELRVEAFSLPLGLALLGAGIIGMRPGARAVPATLASWPAGFSGSWRLLAPGIILTFLPSVLATGTDPQTWRAILVMSLALVAILIGSTRRLAAPFLISLAVLPIEVAVVFTVQIGRTINPLLWWITLATIGAVLLVLAITSERKGAESGGLSARLRDLA